jgi:hypothetical protein
MHRTESSCRGTHVSFLIQQSLLEAAELKPLEKSTRVKRDTKRIGDISEARVLIALMEAGYAVSKPFGEGSRYDLIADDGEALFRVQVKTGRLRGGVIKYSCSSSHTHRGGSLQPYFRQVDFLAIYCPETRKVYLLPESQLVATFAHLRVAPTRNGMTKGVRWADQFELLA